MLPGELFQLHFLSVQPMPNALPVGTILRNQYLIQELLGDGAFNGVYLANAVSLLEDSRGKRYISTRFALKEVVIPSRHLRHHINLEAVPLRGIDHEALPHISELANCLITVSHANSEKKCLLRQLSRIRFQWLL